MDWTKIIWAIMLGAILIWMIPRAKQMMENSPKGSASDWMGFVIPIIAIAVFIILLVKLV